MRRFIAALAVFVLVGSSLGGQPADVVDLDAVYAIKEEGLQRSRVMEIASYLTDVYGPRLTGSPNIRRAAPPRIALCTHRQATLVAGLKEPA